MDDPSDTSGIITPASDGERSVSRGDPCPFDAYTNNAFFEDDAGPIQPKEQRAGTPEPLGWGVGAGCCRGGQQSARQHVNSEPPVVPPFPGLPVGTPLGYQDGVRVEPDTVVRASENRLPPATAPSPSSLITVQGPDRLGMSAALRTAPLTALLTPSTPSNPMFAATHDLAPPGPVVVAHSTLTPLFSSFGHALGDPHGTLQTESTPATPVRPNVMRTPHSYSSQRTRSAPHAVSPHTPLRSQTIRPFAFSDHPLHSSSQPPTPSPLRAPATCLLSALQHPIYPALRLDTLAQSPYDVDRRNSSPHSATISPFRSQANLRGSQGTSFPPSPSHTLPPPRLHPAPPPAWWQTQDAKPVRFKPTREQLAVLVDSYQRNKYPDANERERVRMLLGSSVKPKALSTWYQNARSRSKRRERDGAEDRASGSKVVGRDIDLTGNVSTHQKAESLRLEEESRKELMFQRLISFVRDDGVVVPILVLGVGAWTRFLTPGTLYPDLAMVYTLSEQSCGSQMGDIRFYIRHSGDAYRIIIPLDAARDIRISASATLPGGLPDSNTGRTDGTVAVSFVLERSAARYALWRDQWIGIGDFSDGMISAGGRVEVTGDKETLISAFGNVSHYMTGEILSAEPSIQTGSLSSCEA